LLLKTPLTRRQAAGLLVLVAVLWSLGGIGIKKIDLNPLALAGGRSAVAAVVLILLIGWPRFSRDPYQLGGAIAYAATVFLFVSATKLTTAANAILLQYTAPVWVVMFSAGFLGEKTTRRDWYTLVAVMVGIALFFLDKVTFHYMIGNLCAIGSGFAFAWLVLFLRKQKACSPFEILIQGNLLVAMIGLPFFFLTSPAMFDLLGVSFLGVFQLGLSYFLFAAASRYVKALDLTLIPALEPILNPLWVLLVIHEVPGSLAVLGGLIVLTSVTLRSLFPEKRSV